MRRVRMKIDIDVHDADALIDAARCREKYSDVDVGELAVLIPEGEPIVALHHLFHDFQLPGCEIRKIAADYLPH